MRGQSVLFLLLFLRMAVLVAAQQAPKPASGASYAKHKNKFYVYGGTTSTLAISMVGQFFALNLSIPWTSDAPAWTQLPDGPATTGKFGAAVSLDGKTFLAAPSSMTSANAFSFEADQWFFSKANIRSSAIDTGPVVLRPDGNVLIAGGGSQVSQSNQYDIYSFDTDQTTMTELPPRGANGTLYMLAKFSYSAVWSDYLKSAVFFGGEKPANKNNEYVDLLTLYTPATKEWKGVRTKGFSNRTIFDHCMDITDDGKRIILFGGLFYQDAFPGHDMSNELFSLDLETLTWTKLASDMPPRYNAACTVAGDQFLLWGGYGSIMGNQDWIIDAHKTSTPVYVYNLATGKWANQYKPTADYLEQDPPKPANPGTSSPGSNGPPESPKNQSGELNIGAIVGGAVGSLAVVVAIIGFFVWRIRRRGRKRGPQQLNPSFEDYPGGFSSGDLQSSKRTKKEARRARQQSAAHAETRSPQRYSHDQPYPHSHPYAQGQSYPRNAKNYPVDDGYEMYDSQDGYSAYEPHDHRRNARTNNGRYTPSPSTPEPRYPPRSASGLGQHRR